VYPGIPGRSPRQQFPPPRKNSQGFSLARSGALSAPIPARPKSWQFCVGGEKCCHDDCLGSQGVSSTSAHHQTEIIRLVSPKLVRRVRPVGRFGRFLKKPVGSTSEHHKSIFSSAFRNKSFAKAWQSRGFLDDR